MSDWTEAFDAAVVRTIANEDRPYTIADATTRTSLGVDAMERLVRAVGLRWPEPGESAFGEADLAFFESYALACAAFGDELTLHFARNMSMAMARVGHAAVALFLVTMGESLRGQPEPAQLAGAELSGAVFNGLPPVLERLMRLHALRAVQRWRQHRDRPERFDVQPLAVGFVDLVGFTEQTRDLDASDLAALVVRFETLAHDAVSSSGGEVVKLIGDEVMFVADSAADACRVARALEAAFAGGEITPRGGVAYGPVLARGGDFYGSIVNIAARLTALAEPGEVLVTGEVTDAVGPAHEGHFAPAGRRALKGFPTPVKTYSLASA
jgi:adenylate cyclase